MNTLWKPQVTESSQHSGVSWAVNAGEKVVQTISNWPNPRASNASEVKVPSLVSYVDGHPSKWGYEVTPKDESLQWMKLLLEPNEHYAKQTKHIRQSEQILHRLQKEAIHVVADYLRFLWDFTVNDIRRKYSDNYKDIYDLKVVITVPAMWSPAAKDRTLSAAKLAGLANDITIVTEPEAAAHAVLQNKDRANELKVKLGSQYLNIFRLTLSRLANVSLSAMLEEAQSYGNHHSCQFVMPDCAIGFD
jgi:hypothetical protein